MSEPSLARSPGTEAPTSPQPVADGSPVGLAGLVGLGALQAVGDADAGYCVDGACYVPSTVDAAPTDALVDRA
ncbi:hypothetical protein FE374_11875 [Georgenia yuyongxinii]|uniref:Uncharacterized protein n=1 Tax=Georgenia yuyongxinii TaxID=2589797 RepID=A0A5B8C7X5_9MICO|nr:hypothetical protein [Georgenia yuyongxinii]QDC25212.1 hypothetical protein FE374_11875 [Georgenia yuyongxinii]